MMRMFDAGRGGGVDCGASRSVIPAKAGIHHCRLSMAARELDRLRWTPAFAGVTETGGSP